MAKLLLFFQQPQFRLGLFTLLLVVAVSILTSRLSPHVSSTTSSPMQMWVLHDPAVTTAEQAMQQPSSVWQPSNSPFSYAGEDGFWLRIQVSTTLDDAIRLRAPWLDEVQFYQFDAQGVLLKQLQTGDQYPFSTRPLSTADWVLPLQEQCTTGDCQFLLYIRHTGQVQFSLELQSSSQLLQQQQQQQLILAVQLGLMLFVLLLSSLLALLTARADYAWLTLQLAAVMWILLERTGAGFQWLWPDTPQLNLWSGLAMPLLVISSCALLLRYFQPGPQMLIRKALVCWQLLALFCGLQQLWLIWLPAPSWQAFLNNYHVYLLIGLLPLACIAAYKPLWRQPIRTLLLLLPWLLLHIALINLHWPANERIGPVVAPWLAVWLTTLAAVVLVSGRLSQLYLKKLGLNRIQQQLLMRNQQLAALQQQELLRSRIAPFYQLGSRLALTELLQKQLQQSSGRYRLLLIEFQQFDALEALLGRQTATELLQLYLDQLQLFCQQHSPTVISLGSESYQTIYALSPARMALILQNVDFVAAFTKVRALLQQRLSLDTLAPDLRPRYSSILVDETLATDAEDLLAHALLALSNVENTEGYVNYQPQLAAKSKQKLALITDLSQAAALQQLSLSFQPVQDLTSQRIIALEAFLRWEHPIHGQVSPAIFIPLAEEAGFIHQLTRWVYRQVRQTQDLLFQQGHQLQIAINLSGYDLENHRLMSSILKHELQYPTAQKVKFELTESAMLRDSVAARQSLALLQRSGAVLVMDDFGAGQSVFSKLMALQVHEIKIDMALLRMLGTQREVVLAAMIRLAKSMAMRVVCEGVESQPQYDFLTLHNVDAVQGYFIARPMPLSQLRPWLNNTVPSAALSS